MITKKRVYYSILFIFICSLFFIKAVPQAQPYEALTKEGGYYGVSYSYFSIFEIIQKPDKHFSWFPHNAQTKRYNLIALIIALLVIVTIGWFFILRIKKANNK